MTNYTVGHLTHLEAESIFVLREEIGRASCRERV